MERAESGRTRSGRQARGSPAATGRAQKVVSGGGAGAATPALDALGIGLASDRLWLSHQLLPRDPDGRPPGLHREPEICPALFSTRPGAIAPANPASGGESAGHL